MPASVIDFGNIGALVAATRSGSLTPTDIVTAVLEAIALSNRPEAWLAVVDAEVLYARARDLEAARNEAATLALYGVPFAIKDNIDAAGLATSAGCPAFAYLPECDAPVVAALLAAGAILVGKTHMDQFATGLVGTRSPWGPCRNAHVADRIAGGSSSGSAVVVAQGIVAFALGTDTAGSGRVPAALNGVVGLKPTRGRVSTRGVVAACASLDCVSVFARGCEDAARVLDVLDATADAQAVSHIAATAAALPATPQAPVPFRFGVPAAPALDGLDDEARALFASALALLREAGGSAVEIDYTPFRETAELLYGRSGGGAWLAERDAAFGDFVRAHPEAVDPTVAAILRGAADTDAAKIAGGREKLRALQQQIAPAWSRIDVLVVPTAPWAWRIADVAARPLEASAAFGLFNNFMNLADMAGCAIPTGAWNCGVPFGVTLCGPAWSEPLLVAVGAELEKRATAAVPHLARPTVIHLAVVGAHLRGMPLNHQLVELDARFVAATRTSPDYRLYALAGTVPPKPGLRRTAVGGAAIEVEIWALAPAAFGRFVASVPRPLAIGRLTLEDGHEVSGFVCEPEALEGAEDITHFGGWRAFRSRS